MKLFLTACLLASFTVTAPAFALDFDREVPANTKEQMNGDLTFVATLEGSSATPLHKQVFGELKGPLYKDWFFSRIKRVGYNGNMSGGAVAYVQPFFDSEKMYLTQNYTNFSHPQIARLMIFFHEARHTENAKGNWMHANCPRPFRDKDGNDMKSIWTGMPLAGEAGCDSVAIGSYGLSVVMNKNISKTCTNCTEKVKMDAGFYADDQFKRITNANAAKQLTDDLYGSAN